MSQPLHVYLTGEQRTRLEKLIKKGKTPARIQTRARILLLSDRSQGAKQTRQQVAEATLCCAVTVGSICRRFVQEGMEAALIEKPRPGKAPKITGEIEAQLVTLACSDPPLGALRWTLRLLAEKMVELELVESISSVAVYKRLKKHAQALDGKVLVHQQSVSPFRSEDGGCPRSVLSSLRSEASGGLPG